MVDLANRLREPPGQRHAARADPDQRELVDAAMRGALRSKDFVGDAGKAATPIRSGVERTIGMRCLFAASGPR